MKLYVVYFRTMVDSPEVEIKCATTSKFIAEQALTKAQREADEWMADEDENSSNWAEACVKVFDGISPAYGPGALVHVTVETAWVDDRKRRVKIEILMTECGCKIHEELEFPKRGEDMEFGTEFEWYYSLREVTDQIMSLKVGDSMNFKIRDDQKSHGTILRTA